MHYLNSNEWSNFLNDSLKRLLEMKPVPYTGITPSVLPMRAGVYLISEIIDGIEVTLYVGRSKNLQERIYRNHLMGDLTNARLKKYIVNDSAHPAFGDKELAKKHIKTNCQVRWIFEDDFRRRGALEGYFTAKLFPKYGIAEEH